MRSRAVILGHRGGRGEGWPAENTLAAFERATREGADGVELDVRLTADGVPIVLHDPTFTRSSGGADIRAASDLAFSELPAFPGGERVPSLEDALDAMRGHIVNVEIKADVGLGSLFGDVPARLRLARATAAVVKRASNVEIVFSSFDPLIVVALVGILPRVPRAILIGPKTPRAATALPRALRPAVVAAHLYDPLITAPRVERLTRAGLRTVAWTVNDAARATALVDQGVSWIITDSPLAIVAAVTAK